MRVIRMGKRSFAVGLRWYVWKTDEASQKKHARATRAMLRSMAQTKGADLDVVAFWQRQYGLGASAGQEKACLGASSLVASLQLPSANFIGLFQLEDQAGERFWWVWGINESLIAGDDACATREAAEVNVNVLKDLLELNDLVICETVEDSLQWLAPLIKTDVWGRTKLKALQENPGQQRKMIGIGCLIGSLILGGYALQLFFEHKAGQEVLESARIALLNTEKHRAELLAHPERHFVSLWLNAPTMQGVAVQCIPDMLALPTVASGWALESAVCTEKNMTLAWSHRPGADFMLLPPFSRLESPQKAVSRLPVTLPKAPKRADVFDQLWKQSRVTQHLYQVTQLAGGRLKLSFGSPEKAIIEKVELMAPWRVGSFELGDISPSLMFDMSFVNAFAMPGMVLDSVGFINNSWVFKGKIYVR